ncbi:MAG: hypothetical protein Q8Q15_00430, partial [bacterium]|nr:hypothetical protein [bacterium]
LLDKPFNHVVSQASAKPAPEIRKGNQRERTVKKWDVIFPSNDDPKTLRSEAKIIEVIKSKLAEAGCPEWEQEKLVNSFLRFRNDPLHSVKVGVTQGGSVRDKLGKNKLYLDDNWRVLFNLNTGPHGESVIEVYAIIPHGEWDKMQR